MILKTMDLAYDAVISFYVSVCKPVQRVVYPVQLQYIGNSSQYSWSSYE